MGRFSQSEANTTQNIVGSKLILSQQAERSCMVDIPIQIMKCVVGVLID